MGTNADRLVDREREAELFCEKNIRWYKTNKTQSGRAYAILQTAALLLSGVTPILILWGSLPKPLQALPAAVATVATGLLGTFRFRDNQARWAISEETLGHELFNFKNRIGPAYGLDVDPEIALVQFVKTVEDLVINETADWRRLTSAEVPSPQKFDQ